MRETEKRCEDCEKANNLANEEKRVSAKVERRWEIEVSEELRRRERWVSTVSTSRFIWIIRTVFLMTKIEGILYNEDGD